jgi:hypothetical protein
VRDTGRYADKDEVASTRRPLSAVVHHNHSIRR